MLRFYFRYHDGKYIVIDEMKNDITLFAEHSVSFYPRQLELLIMPALIEIIMSPWSYDVRDIDRVKSVKIIDWEYINGSAIKAANDNNERFSAKKEAEDISSKLMNSTEFKYKIQSIIDMRLAYGMQFEKEFYSIIEQLKEKYKI